MGKNVVVELNDGNNSLNENVKDIYLYKDKNEINWLSLTVHVIDGDGIGRIKKINIPVERFRKYETIIGS